MTKDQKIIKGKVGLLDVEYATRAEKIRELRAEELT